MTRSAEHMARKTPGTAPSAGDAVKRLFFQPKLSVSQPDNVYEQEADDMADRVMRKAVSRKCKHCEEEEKRQLQRKENDSAAPQVDQGFERYVAGLDGTGRPLSVGERNFFEPRFNRDFSDVRIHTDSQAAQSAQRINALAYTKGNNIVFNQGQYQPTSESGRRLMAHELTHVVQQSNQADSVQRMPFGDFAMFDSLPGGSPIRAIVSGPYSDRAIAETLYGDPDIAVVHDSADYSIIIIDESLLLDRWRRYFPELEPVPEVDTFGLSEEDLTQVGLIALGNTLRTNAADSVGVLRAIYNNGVTEIVAQRAQMIRAAMSPEAAERVISGLGNNLDRRTMIRLLEQELSPTQAANIARTVSTMRHDLALNVRRTGGMILQRGAELIDAVRGQARPTYDALRAAGKSDAQIIISATRTNNFVNNLPRGMRLTGGVLLVASAGFSIYLIISADEEDRSRVIREEAGGFAGGMLGSAAATAACIATGIATAGFGLIVCGLIGGTIGAAAGRDPYGFLQMLDIAPRHSSGVQGKMYRLQGTLEEIDLFVVSIPQVTVSASQHALVIATGMISGELVGGRGHYRDYQVVAANAAAEDILGTSEPVYVPQYVLRRYTAEDLLHE